MLEKEFVLNEKRIVKYAREIEIEVGWLKKHI